MKYLLTDGSRYISYKKRTEENCPEQRGAVIITNDEKKAFRFDSKEEAEAEKRRLKKKAKTFHVTEAPVERHERQVFDRETRKAVYRRTEGHCYLCGAFVDFDDFEIEHRIPLASGGSNDTGNLACSCHTCNAMKGSLGYDEFLEHVAKIAAFHPSAGA